MLNLNCVLTAAEAMEVQRYANIRFREGCKLRTREALALYEQQYLPSEQIKQLCEAEYGFTLYEPLTNYIPDEIVSLFRDTGLVPVAYMVMTRQIHAVYLPEFPPDKNKRDWGQYQVETFPTTIYYFLEQYQQLYGRHPMLQELPCKMIFESIIKEAIALGAADITMSTVRKRSRVYYNVRKKQVASNRIFSAEMMRDIITLLCIKSPYETGTRVPKYVDVDLTDEYRGRVVINAKFRGYVIVIRLLPNKAFNTDLQELNLKPKTIDWMQTKMMDNEPGLRLIVGATMSGKNTTALALLKQLVQSGMYKVVSVEMPVEQELPGVEQINTETLEEYSTNIRSLIHQNPDFVYITEIRDATAYDTVQIANTGKRVLSTLHSNSVEDTITRLTDVTGLSADRVIQTLHSIVFQELVRDEATDTVRPSNKFLRLTEELKYQLYGKSVGEVIKILRGRVECEE